MGARLFTATDVERAARLAAQAARSMSTPDHDVAVNYAVANAVDVVVEDAPLFYSETEVRSMLQYTLSKEDVDAELADAVQAIGR